MGHQVARLTFFSDVEYWFPHDSRVDGLINNPVGATLVNDGREETGNIQRTRRLRYENTAFIRVLSES